MSLLYLYESRADELPGAQTIIKWTVTANSVDVARTLEQAPEDNPAKALLKDKICISDPGSGPDDEPSAQVASKLARSFDATRQETLRVRALGAAALVFAGVAVVAVWQYREARLNEAQAKTNEEEAIKNEQQAVENAIKFYDFCSAARQQVAAGQVKLDDLERETEFGQLVARIARDVARLPEPADIACGQDPREAPASPGG